MLRESLTRMGKFSLCRQGRRSEGSEITWMTLRRAAHGIGKARLVHCDPALQHESRGILFLVVLCFLPFSSRRSALS